MYKYTQSVLKQVKWSKELDDDFKEIYKSNTDLQYQYFGDASGSVNLCVPSLNIVTLLYGNMPGIPKRRLRL